jgi:hypothetical protein
MAMNTFPMSASTLRSLKVDPAKELEKELEKQVETLVTREVKRITDEVVKEARRGKTRLLIPNTYRTVYIHANSSSLVTTYQDGPSIDVLPLTIKKLFEVLPDCEITYSEINSRHERGYLTIDWSK